MGRFIELGRVDVTSRGRLSLEVFERNASFFSFDIGVIYQQKPELIGSLMAEVAALHRQGVIKPIDIITTYDVSELEQALTFMGKGDLVGGVVVSYTNPRSMVKVVPYIPPPSFDGDAAYILTGCSGPGVGHTMASWLVGRGARHLFFLSRSGAEPPSVPNGVNVQFTSVKCDVTDRDQVQRALGPLKARQKIKGVIHAAAVFEDVSVGNMSFEQLHKVLDPKVRGTINLHEATLDQPLDFFTMTSSIIAVVNTATQSSYSAGNSFQDAFARFRYARNLPALSLALGMISDVGFASRQSEVQQSLQRNGIYGTTQKDLLKLFDMAFASVTPDSADRFDPWSDAHLLIGLEPAKIYQLDPDGEFIWSSDPRFSRIVRAIADIREKRQSTADSGTTKPVAGPEKLLAQAAKLRDARKSNLKPSPDDVSVLHDLAQAILVERIAKMLSLVPADVEVDRDISAFGIDSMVGAELRGWLLKSFGLNVSFGELVAKGMKITTLRTMLIDKLA